MKRTFSDGFRAGRFSPLALAGMIAGGLALAVVLGFLLGWIVMLLWNSLMPQIFGLPRISYWQGIGLVILSHILFGGLAGGRGGSHDGGAKGRREKNARAPDGEPVPDDSWCESCDTCDNTESCRPFAHGWIRTAYGWKQDAGEDRKA
jgi:hypothetical protein